MEGGRAGQQFVQDRAQAVHVGCRADLGPVARRLLGRHVAWRARDYAGGRHVDCAGEHLREAEVGHVGLAIGVEQDVRRLQVAVNDPLLVQMFDGPSHGGHQPHGGVDADWSLLDPFGEALAGDVLHREEVLAVKLADVVDVDDVRVSQSGGGLGFGLKAADQLGRSEVAGQDHLDGHRAVEPFLPGLVDDAHAAAADLADQLVRAEIARQLPPVQGWRGVGVSVAAGDLFLRRRRQLFERIEAIQRRGQFGMLPHNRIPIRRLACLQPGEIRIEEKAFRITPNVIHWQ